MVPMGPTLGVYVHIPEHQNPVCITLSGLVYGIQNLEL